MSRPNRTVRNEQRKLFATSINAVGLTIFGIGGLTPLLTRAPSAGGMVSLLVSALIAIILHSVAQTVLRGLEE